MKVKESAPPSIPAPRVSGESPPTQGFGGLRRPLKIANSLLGATAATVLIVGYLVYRRAHPQGLALDQGSDDLNVMIVAAVALLFALGNLVIRPHTGVTWRLWASSLWFSSLCLLCVAGIWALTFRDTGTQAIPGTQVSTSAQVTTYLNKLGPRGAALPRIPTGAFVQSVEFADANDVKVTGYLWQRYGRDIPKGFRQGVALPEAADAYAAKEVYRTKDAAGQETVGWYFQATLRQQFDYKHYPLDFQSVWLRLWSADMTRKALLVPDFASYPPWKINGRYGLDPGFVSDGWRTRYTAYSYAANDYTSSFGMVRYSDKQPFPELYFNVGMARDFVNPLIARLLPVAFIVSLIFASLFVVTTNSEKRGVSGFSIFSVIGFSVSMLLVVTVQHTSLRNTLGESGLVYLEYFYVALYALILMVALNAVLMPTSFADRFFDWRGNLLPRLLYWPIFMALILAATLYSFSL
jgi:hypothetical protein